MYKFPLRFSRKFLNPTFFLNQRSSIYVLIWFLWSQITFVKIEELYNSVSAIHRQEAKMLPLIYLKTTYLAFC